MHRPARPSTCKSRGGGPLDKLTVDDLSDLFAAVGQVMAEQAETLGEMDARMGDGDLGLTMKKGFTALPGILAGLEETDLGKRLMRAGMAMASAVPSTMGTLMASGLLSGGRVVTGRVSLDGAGFAAYLDGFAEGIAKRGKCAPGDCTVLDAVRPAADAAAALLERDPAAGLEDVARAALEGAREGVEATRAMRPKFGKAAVFAGKALGTPDQGACAGLFMIQGYCNFICT